MKRSTRFYQNRRAADVTHGKMFESGKRELGELFEASLKELVGAAIARGHSPLVVATGCHDADADDAMAKSKQVGSSTR